MNKVFLYAAFLAFFAIAVPAQAQTTDEAAPAEATAPVADPAPAPEPVSIPVISAPSTVLSTESASSLMMREGVPLRVRQEQPFDANGNNRLEPDEIRAFFKSVREDSNAGPVKNTSDVLYPFDRNKDGFIDRSEASSLPGSF
jgi:hypothetical protein